jgi:gliding motility-associated-like protein
MKVFLRLLLVVFFLSSGFTALATKLYWIGGSGNFNDPAHWSYESGGMGGTKIPTISDDVTFDENSFTSPSVINFIGNTQVHDFLFSQYTYKVVLTGLQNEKITIAGDLKLNAYTDNQFAGDFKLISNQPATNIYFSLATCKGNVYFDGNTNWVLRGNLITDDNSSVYLKQGNFNLTDAGVYTGNLIASSSVVINTSNTVLNMSNKFVLPIGITLNDAGQSRIYAFINDTSKYIIASGINFSGNSRFINLNNVTTCAVTNTSNKPPTCSGACNGTMIFAIPLACSSNPVYAVWSTGGGCTTIPTGTLTPGTSYTVSNVCGCGTQYSVVFTNNPITQDSTYAQYNISLADPIPAKINNFILKQPSCFGKCDGKIIAVLNTFGQTPITNTWTSSTFTGTVVHSPLSHGAKDTLKNACAGTYTAVLTDANGCISTASVTTLGQPSQVTASGVVTNLLCNNVCTGSIMETVSGGTGAAYTYTWSPVGGTTTNTANTSTYSNLCAGTYSFTAADVNSCTVTNTYTVTQPPVIVFTKNPASGIINIPCNNTCNGTIGVTGVSGGVGGYTYSWLPAGGSVTSTSTTSTYSGLCGSPAGITYTCTIKDANNCSTKATFTVISPPALSHTITATNPKCNVGATGSATVTEGGGTAPYTFTWSPLGGSQNGPTLNPNIYSNIGGGTYSVFITDNKGCLDSAKITLTPPPALTATITTTTNPTCPNLNNGHICVTAGGGTGAYTYTWTPIGGNAACTPATLTVTPGGTSVYTVTVSDANLCQVTVTGTLTSPPQATVTLSQTNPKCGSAPCTSSATLTPNGGTGPFTYAWSCSGSVTNTISGQCGGTTCNYTVTDVGTNCKYTGSVIFAPAPPILNVNISATALACNGDCNSVITSTVTGGTLGYTYSWSGTGANPVVVGSSNQINMCAGNYTCQVTDNLGCVKQGTVNIASPPALTVNIAATQPSCSGICNGSMLATITGGTAPYPGVNWSPSVSPPNPPGTLNPTGLCGTPAPGTTYTLTITDSKGCTGTGNATLITPPALTITVNTGSVTCSGLCNGTATAVVSGGVSPYTYSWNGGAFSNSATASGLCVGSHTLIVKDAGGCIGATQIFNIVGPNPISTTVINITNTCGACSGSATANPSGGTSPYTYTWTPSGGNGATANGLCIGNYTLSVGDANGCPRATATFTISPIVIISIAATSQSVSCNNACDGVANATASAGLAPYTMVWTSSPTNTVVTTCNNVVSCSATNLCPGTYVITASDVNGCVNKDSVVIGNPPALTLGGSSTNTTCFGQCNGSATVTPAGGTPAYTVTWNTGASGNTISNLCPGTYTANVTDSKGCPATKTYTITSKSQLNITNSTVAPLACGGLTGSITSTASGGTAPYTFVWNPVGGGTVTTVSPTSTLSGVPAGNYTVTITDVNGCDTVVQIGLSDPGSPTVTATTQSVSCFGSTNGSATVTAVGTPAIVVTWPGGVPTGPSPLTVNNLGAGVYVVQVTDGNGCHAFTNVTITGPSKIQDNANIVQPNCSAGGTITLNPSGGSGGGYTYNWDGGASSSNPLSGASSGTHTCVVTDGNLCTQTFTYSLSPPGSLTVAVISNNTLCSYSSNGSASANVSGGTPPYSYTWTPVGGSGVNLSTVSNLPAGNYTVHVADAGGCATQQTFTINAAPVIIPNFSKTNNLCNAGCTGSATVAPTGGAGTYTYNWSPGGQTGTTVSNMCPNNYTVIVTDANNCKDTTRFTIVQPPVLTASVTSTNPTCFGMCNGSATVTVSGGTGTTYTVGWSPNICLNCPVANNLCGGIPYTITSTDSNGCTNVQTLNLTSPTKIQSNPTVTDPVCFSNCNGSVVSNTSGGTLPYTYVWSPLGAGTVTNTPTTSTYTNLCAGTYTLITHDAKGCADTSTHVVNNPTQLQMTASATSASCGQTNGSITISSVNGNGVVTVQWINPAICGSSLNCNNLGFGVYSVQLTDSKGCTDTFFVAITNPNGPDVDSLVVNDHCNGICNGSITVNVVSGINVTTPYSFTWTPSGLGSVTTTTNSSTYSNLCAGVTIISTVKDSLGCGTATTFVLTQPSAIQDNGNSTNATCLGINNGTIHSVASGGTPGTMGYTYTLDGGATNATGIFTNLAAGTHTVCIKDSLNCSKCFTYQINGNTTVLSNISSTNQTCAGICNGTATLSNVSGGNAPYVISWSNGQSAAIATALCAGTYTAIITDNNGCKAQDTITLIAPTPITPHATITNPACGQCNGTIAVAPTGGTPGSITTYTYSWNTGSASSNISNVCPGVYQIDITDSLGCKQSFQLPVSNSGAPSVTVTTSSPVCSNACTGSATVTASGGVAPYSYSWPTGGQTGTTISNQCSGLYFVQVKDSLGCIATDSALIKQGTVLNVVATMSNPPCGVCTGTITANVSGGSGNYSYNWQPGGANTASITNVCAGNYTLTVTDNSNGCTKTSIIGLNNNTNGPTLNFSTTNVLCNNICNGTATVTASNGTPGYTYLWSNSQITPSISNLCQGVYAVQVKDANGCIQTGQVIITQPNPLIASFPVISQPRCNNDCNGSITTIISGGTPSYTYAWNPGSISGSGGINLCAGNYSVTVTDSNGCTVSESATLINPALLSITGTVTPASCNNVADGAINTTTTGGTPSLTAPGYTWQWSGGSAATTANLSNILTGNYTVIVSDSRNCTDTANFTVVSTITVSVNAGKDTTACAIGTLVLNGTVSSGTNVQWLQLPNPPVTIVGVTPSVTVTPALGTTQYVLIGQNGACTNSDTVKVTSNVLPVPEAGNSTSTFTGVSVSIGGSPTNSSGGTITWSPGAGMSDSTMANPIVSPTITTTYTVFETNSNGCKGWDTVTVTILPTFVIPNGFSPNGDGYNDIWQIDYIYLFPDCEIEVFNRWGEPLFYSRGYNTPWNGTYNGKPVPVGTYYYLIRLHDKDKKFPDHYTGPLTILR